MEVNALDLNLAILNINFIAAQNNWDILEDTHQIPMPVGHVLICDTPCYIEHDDGALPLNVVAIA